MKPDLTDWHEDVAADQEEQYSSFLRALRRKRGFGILFVRCSPAEGERAIARVREDLPQKKIEVLSLEEPINKLYQRVEELPNREEINILFVRGLEKSFYEYEERKRQEGWDSKEIYSYSQKGVPPVLVNINQQRERFRDNFRFVLVFLLPLFGIDYFIHRAPDFFDWRSGLFELYDISELSAKSLAASSIDLSEADRKVQLIEIETWLKDNRQSVEEKANLLSGQRLLLLSAERYEDAVASCDKALELNPDDDLAYFFQGNALYYLSRYDDAIASYDKALEIKPDHYQALYKRGNALYNLGRYSEAIASYDKALEIKPDNRVAWNNRGVALGNLSRYSEAIASYDKALEIKPDHYQLWNNRGIALGNLGRDLEAIDSYDKALATRPDYYEAWNNRGNVLCNLGRHLEALASFDKALEAKPYKYETWYARGIDLSNLGCYSKAIASFDKALEFNPDYYEAWYGRGNALGNLGRYSEAIASHDKALEIKPDYYEAWNNRGNALGDRKSVV